MSSTLATPEPRHCRECGAAPIDPDSEYCSLECYRADSYTCERCGAFTPQPMAHRKRHHPETLPEGHDPDDDTAPVDLPASPRVNTADVADADPTKGPHCVNCGNEDVLQRTVDVAGDGTAVNGCRECLPRSVRFGEDVYGRTREEAERSYDLDAPNRGKDAADLRNS